MVIVREVSRVLHRSTSNSSSVPHLPPALDTTPPPQQQTTQQHLSRSPLQQPVSTSSPLLSHVPQPTQQQQQQQSLEELGSLNLSRESEDLVVKVYPLKMKSMLLTLNDRVPYAGQCSGSVTFWYGSGSLETYTGLWILLFSSVDFKKFLCLLLTGTVVGTFLWVFKHTSQVKKSQNSWNWKSRVTEGSFSVSGSRSGFWYIQIIRGTDPDPVGPKTDGFVPDL
jgi:hypothetical protein